jgi:hypothetical protein
MNPHEPLTYPDRYSGLRTAHLGLANTGVCGPAIGAKTRRCGPTLSTNRPTLVCEGLANTPCEWAKGWNISAWHGCPFPRDVVSKVNGRFARWFIPENPHLNQWVCLQDNVKRPFYCKPRHNFVAQFIAVCRRPKWSRHLTNSPRLALLATAGSNAACKILSACSHAFWCRTFRKN